MNTHRGKDFTDGSLDLEICCSTVHVPTDHVGHRLYERGVQEKSEDNKMLVDILEKKSDSFSQKYGERPKQIKKDEFLHRFLMG